MKETCDRCGPTAAAPNRWEKDGKVLHFCEHHSKKHEAALTEQGFKNVSVLLPV